MKKLFIEETITKIGQEVELYGWVDTKRDHRKVIFIDLRDRSGIVQVVGGEEFKHLTSEDVVYIKGIVKERPEKLINPKIQTGKIEIEAKEFKVLNKAQALPIPINTDGYEVDEEIRLKYRYLDLRRERMKNNLILRSNITTFIRNYLTDRKFIEVETPVLTKTTPEGARDFLVPSRLQKGKFYALPQSPQQYKQLLMVAGIERYFQLARCFRDEDPRADRAYGEFTQLDMEMSFITQDDIMKLVEEMFTEVVKKYFPEKHISQTPWPRLSHKYVKEKYGTDKPDLRKDKNDKNELAFSWTIDFPLFTEQSADDFFHGSGQAKFAPSHHMFTAPHPDDIPLLDTDPLKVRGLQHDLVLNGYEVGGGSIRIHQGDVQQKVFDLIGFTTEQKAQFNHMLTAFTYGVPPHGGIAPGIDRFIYVALGEPSLREVVAFPATSGGKIAVMDAPSEAAEEQLHELGISVINKKKISVLQQIQDLLNEHKIKFELMTHKPVLTSEEASAVRGTKLEQGAKALIMYADTKPIMIVLAAHRKIDNAKFKTAFKIKDLRMAKPDEVKEVTNTEIGAVPPFGNLFEIPLYVDKSLGENETIVFNAGTHTDSISMLYKDFEKSSKPMVGEFSK